MTRVSIKDVARLADVSIATVSRCINTPDLVKKRTRTRVEAAIRETGYSPNTLARSFRRGKTNVIMVVMSSVGDPFFTELMQGIRQVARNNDYSLLIDETQFNTLTEDEIGAMVVSRMADGIILLGSLSPFGTRVLSERSQRALPIVIGGETVSADLAEFPGVHVDNATAAREATEHLLSLGHRRIAFISGQEDSLVTRGREDGYRNAMEQAGLNIEDGWVIVGGLTTAGGRAATRKLLDHPDRPTAIFCANDEMAMGCIHEVKARGLSVPGDISVVGFDDTRYAEIMDPPLTTVRQPTKEIGERVMQRLLEEIENGRAKGHARSEILAHELIVRKSTARPES